MIQSTKNQFKGVNPHLNSKLQDRTGSFPDFHTMYIATLKQFITLQLRAMGYTALVEKSLQIRRLGEEHTALSPRADVLVFDPEVRRYPSTQPVMPMGEAAVGTMEVILSLPSILVNEDIDYYHAIKVYMLNADRQEYGDPVAWIELLSPSNKRGHDLSIYQEKRENILLAGIVYVEIDYLHETPPTFKGVASYPDQKPNAYPFRITVIDPRPKLDEGKAHSWQFGVNMPIPTLAIRLNASDVININFDGVYQKTFEDNVYGDVVDYSQPPVNFERYSPNDQQLIQQRLTEITEQA
jgi:Protein of unknown function (DUF4058)